MSGRKADSENRNSEQIRIKLINAVGEIITTEGYTGLGVTNIAKTAGVDKDLIYKYFDSSKNLIETYLQQKDYWIAFNTDIGELIEKHKVNNGKTLSSLILEQLFDHLKEEKEMQKLILWEINEKSYLINEIINKRETIGDELFKISEPSFKDTNIDLRAIYALLLAGVYHLVLDSNGSGGNFCGININSKPGRDRIVNAMRYILDGAFEDAEQQQSTNIAGDPDK